MYNTILLVWYSWIPALLCHVYYIQGKINQLLNFIKSLSNHCMVIDHFRHFNLRIASDCERDSRIQKPVPPDAIQDIEKIAKSVQRT